MAPSSNTKLRPYLQAPQPGDEQNVAQFYDWLVTSLNTLIGQQVPPTPGFNSLNNPQLNPASTQLASAGARVNSITTAITYVAAANSISFYWDGTNGSTPLTIYRDDNTKVGPFVGHLTVSGLAASTKYYFYPFFQDFTELPPNNIQNITAEPLGSVVFASVPAAKPVGTPPVAYTSQNSLALQRQFLLDHIPLGLGLATTGVTTGSGGGSGGGGGGGGGGACPLAGAPVRLYGDPNWWLKSQVPCQKFMLVGTASGRIGVFSRNDRRYCRRGLLPLTSWQIGDWALTEAGEELVTILHRLTIAEGMVDRYEAAQGHIYSAWGFIGHNAKVL